MEHVLDPSGIKILSITVPHLCKDTFEYDTGFQFSGYGQTLNYDEAKAQFIETQENAREFAEILQKWLFFGLVTEWLGTANIKILPNFFIRTTEDDRKVICTAGLNDLLQRWAKAIPTLPLELRAAAALKIQADANVVQVKLKSLGKIVASPVSEVLLSISVAGASITFAMRHVFRPRGTCPAPEWTDSTNYREWGKSRLIVNNLISKGWCPYEVAQLYGGCFSAVGMVFAASLERPRRRETHGTCTEKICRALDIDESTYETRHMADDCTCEGVDFEHNELCSIIKSGGIVVLRLEWDSSTQLKTKILSSQGLKYIALSHVWSDGLGNPFSNSLPACRLEQLDGMVRNMLSVAKTKPVYIWLDTICVTAQEVAKSCSRDIGGLNCRQLAIFRMRDTYRDAAEVLVLDWQLQNSIATSMAEENLLRILVSGWMRRLWTFQEAWVSKKLAVQFQNDIIRVDQQLFELNMQDHLPLWAEVADGFLSNQKSILSDAGQSQRVALLWNALQGRTTSRASDEALVLGSMLGMDITEILKEVGSQRMLKLLSSIDVYPSQILFMPGPRIQELGYGWAPSSFFGRQRWTKASALEENFLPEAEVHTMNIACRPAFRADSGLMLRAPGFLLQPVEGPLCHAFYIVLEDAKFPGVAHYLEQEDIQEWYDRKIEGYCNLAVIIEDNDADPGASCLAVLVSDCQMMGGVLFSKFICRMWFGSSRATDTLPLQDYAVDEASGKKYSAVAQATATKIGQMWCIG